MIEKYTELRAQITRAREKGQEKHRRSFCVRSGRKRAKIGVEKSVMIFIFHRPLRGYCLDMQKPAGTPQPDGCTENVSDRSAVRGPEDDARGRQKIKFPKWELEKCQNIRTCRKRASYGKGECTPSRQVLQGCRCR